MGRPVLSFVHSLTIYLSKCLDARYRQIMDFFHVESRTQISGWVSHDSR